MNTNIRRKYALNAIKAGNLKRLQTLILSKADANLTLQEQSLSLLDQAVDFERHEIAEWLLAHGADPNTHHVVHSPMDGLAQIMFGPIDVDIYLSPLASAIQQEDANMVRILLDAGADLSLPRSIFLGQIVTCGDNLQKNSALASEVEALAISTSLGESSCQKPVSHRGL